MSKSKRDRLVESLVTSQAALDRSRDRFIEEYGDQPCSSALDTIEACVERTLVSVQVLRHLVAISDGEELEFVTCLAKIQDMVDEHRPRDEHMTRPRVGQ